MSDMGSVPEPVFVWDLIQERHGIKDQYLDPGMV